MKTISLKKVAVVAVASLGFGLMSVVPASAALLSTTSAPDVLTMTTPTVTTTVGTAVSSTFSMSATEAGDATLFAGAQISIAKPTGSTVTLTDKNGDATATDPIAQTTGAASMTTTIENDAANDKTMFKFVMDNAIAASTTNVAGTVGFTPDRPGTYVITVTGLTDGAGSAATVNTSVSTTFTVTVRSLAYTTGDGAAAAPFSTGNGIAGAFNTVTVTGHSTQVANVRALVTVDGAGSTISTGGTVAADFKSTLIAAASNAAVVVKTPTAGTITVSLYNETAASSGLFSSTAANTVTITVGTAAVAGGINASSSTAVMNAAATWSSTTEASVTTSRTASATPVAAIKVTLAQTAGAITGSTAVTATITGAGTLLLNADDANPSAATPVTGRSVSSTVGTLGEVFTVGVAPDGTSGVGTVTITAGTYTATKTVTFYGSAATYKATNVLNPTANGVATTDAVLVCATDSAGIAVAGSTIYAYSGDTTVATVETSDATEATAISASGTIPTSHVAKTAVGCVAFDVTGLSQTTKSSVVLTFGNAATQASSTVTTTSTVNVGSVAATTVTLTTNKATYAPGEKMTVTLTFKDSAGRLVGAGPGTGTLAAALTSSTSLTGDALFATANASTLGTIEITVYAPLAQGPVVFTGKTGAAGTYIATAGADLAITATATVVDANQSSLLTQIDALNAKIVALNALIAKIMKKLGVK